MRKINRIMHIGRIFARDRSREKKCESVPSSYTATVALAATLLLSSCIIIPLPEFGGDGRRIPDAAIDKLNPGVTTRAEVLAELGEPVARIANNRAFLYKWSGVVAVGAAPGGGDVLTRGRRLCLEFDDRGVLSRKNLYKQAVLSSQQFQDDSARQPANASDEPCGWQPRQPGGGGKPAAG